MAGWAGDAPHSSESLVLSSSAFHCLRNGVRYTDKPEAVFQFLGDHCMIVKT